ncbi:MAG TPA: hypothetical protein VEY33_05415 [Gemmatimonadota bacterium]|nr:hypothetical protein [Gemmatimonadota bacterium]
MIRGVHTMYYTSEPEALRAFLRDSLGLEATAPDELPRSRRFHDRAL